jgi:hypothetical protein
VLTTATLRFLRRIPGGPKFLLDPHWMHEYGAEPYSLNIAVHGPKLLDVRRSIFRGRSGFERALRRDDGHQAWFPWGGFDSLVCRPFRARARRRIGHTMTPTGFPGKEKRAQYEHRIVGLNIGPGDTDDLIADLVQLQSPF